MFVTTSAESKELDRVAIEDFGIPGIVLMENAARSICQEAMNYWPWLAGRGRRIIILCGPGQNGGDGFVLARLLSARGHQVHAYLITNLGRKPVGDASINYSICRSLSLPITTIENDNDPLPDWSWPELVIDAVFGTGLDRALSGQAARVLSSASRWKAAKADFKVLAVDLPSGLNGDTGAASADVLPADLTISLATMKLGLTLLKGPELSGTVRLGDIGLCPPMLKAFEPKGLLLDDDLAASLLPARPNAAHKGTFGHAVLIGGSIGKTGALELASKGALRSGCGLVTCAHPASLAQVFQSKLTEAMTLCLPEEAPGELGQLAAHVAAGFMEQRAALGLGPGLGGGPAPKALTMELAVKLPKPMVLDADALNNLAGELATLHGAKGPRIITPHPGEAGRLLGLDAAQIEANRLSAASELAKRSGAVTVLKGRHTIIAAPWGDYLINQSGGPVLAAGGSGDLLTGLITGLLAQGLSPIDAASLAVHAHGMAGDAAEADLGQRGVTISEVADRLPKAWTILASKRAADVDGPF